MFNLNKNSKGQKKIAQNAVVTTEKMLIENNEKLGLKPNEEDGNYNKLLESDRENPDGDKNYEKLLADVRVEASENKSILESVLNNAKDTINKLRDEDTNVPLMDFAKKNVVEREKEYQKAVNAGDSDTSFWDKYVGQQLDKDQITKITNNIQSSQLISNYDTREDFNKKNPSIGKKVPVAVDEILKDADAMLYFIYRTAEEESRELSDKDKQIINDINSGKIRILSQFKPEQNLSEEEWDELMREERMLMEADDAESQERMRGEVAEANLPDTLHDQQTEDGLEFGDQFSQKQDNWETQEEVDFNRKRKEEDEISSGGIDPITGEIGNIHPDTPSLDKPWWEISR